MTLIISFYNRSATASHYKILLWFSLKEEYLLKTNFVKNKKGRFINGASNQPVAVSPKGNKTKHKDIHPQEAISNFCGASTRMILKDKNHQTTIRVHINPPRIQWKLQDDFCKNHEQGLSEETEFLDKSTDKEKGDHHFHYHSRKENFKRDFLSLLSLVLSLSSRFWCKKFR